MWILPLWKQRCVKFYHARAKWWDSAADDKQQNNSHWRPVLCPVLFCPPVSYNKLRTGTTVPSIASTPCSRRTPSIRIKNTRAKGWTEITITFIVNHHQKYSARRQPDEMNPTIGCMQMLLVGCGYRPVVHVVACPHTSTTTTPILILLTTYSASNVIGDRSSYWLEWWLICSS